MPTRKKNLIRSREELMYLLTEAAQVEHLALCEYLYAAFSMKLDTGDGLTAEQATSLQRWERVVTSVAVQEMLHLTLVNNLLTAIGGCPYFSRPNFPLTIEYFQPPMVMRLVPFSLDALKHFLFFERPEGVKIDDVPEDMVFAYGMLPSQYASDDIVPAAPPVSTLDGLYQGIQDGLRHLVNRHGEKNVFVGPPRAQATRDHFGWKELIPVTSLESALEAIGVIVEQGEGGSSVHRADSHFGRFARVSAELMHFQRVDPAFDPALPVVPAYVRPLSADPGEAQITNPATRAVAELFDASYELLLQLLTRYFIHSHETDEMLHALSDASVDLMFGAIRPLGRLMARLPVGEDCPGKTAGPAFEVYPTSYILPHHYAAWHVLQERMGEMAHYCQHTLAHAPELSVLGEVHASLVHLRGNLTKHLREKE